MAKEFLGLMTIEQILNAQIISSMTIFKVFRGGQFGFKGHLLNVLQSLHDFVTNLPWKASQLGFSVLTRSVEENIYQKKP